MTTPTDPTELEAAAQRGWSDYEIDQLIGRLLQLGVLIAAIVVIAGGIAFLLQHGHQRPDFSTFIPGPAELRSLSGVIRGAFALHSAAVVQLGLILLIATPVARVALTLVAFLIQRDRLYVLVTAIVLALLVYGLVWGRA